MTLCTAHHRAVHDGKLAITGTVLDGLTFRYADGSTYGTTPNPHAIDTHTKVFGALRGLGFREGDARRALRELGMRSGGKSLTDEVLLREAIALLTAPAVEA